MIRIALIVFPIVFLLFLIMRFLKNLQAKRLMEVTEKLKGKNILCITSNSNFFGLESVGMLQVRGNGVLVLTDEELLFSMWTPKKEISIPLKSIKKTEIVKSFLGKTKFRPLLKVVFQNEKNETDSAAWLVSNTNKW